MSHNYFTSSLIDIQDAIVDNVQHFTDSVNIHFSLKRKDVSCPACNSITNKVHDYRTRIIKDLPIHGKFVYLHYRKRRYVCTCCGKRFYESLPIIPKYHRITNRLALYAINSLEERTSISSVAKRLNVSANSILRWMKYIRFPAPKHLPDVISIDEFRGNAGKEKFQLVITSPKKKEVLDILPTRKQEDIISYLSQFPDRKNVKFVTMDMNRAFFEAVRKTLPGATVIIDKFHVVRYCTWAMENVRKDVQKNLSDNERKYFKRSRTLLLKHRKDLNAAQSEAVLGMLNRSEKLMNAYRLKELFYEFMESKNRTEAKEKLEKLRLYYRYSGLPEFDRCFGMLANWEEYILNAFDTKLSNGFTEGINNSIKVIKRVGFGYKDFDNLRTRILLIHRNRKPTPGTRGW